jgi:hypothetical protein
MKITSKHLGPSYMSPSYLEEVGGTKRELKATIAGVTEAELWGEDRIIVAFQDEHPALTLNLTNFKVLTKLFGRDTSDWIGEEVLLYLVPVEFQGEAKQGIRLKLPAGRSAKPQPAPRSAKESLGDDEIPF